MKLSFFLPTKILMDDNCIKANAALLASFGKKALIVTGARSAKANGSQSDLEAALTANGQSWTMFDKVMSNPTIDCVYEGAALAKAEGADFVVAIGGGSPMDAAKAISLLACEDISRENLFAGGYKTRLPLVCIPTTAGTGSEVTQYSILMNDKAQTKTSLSSPVLFPDLALLDSRYMAGLSQTTMINTVIDAFSHSAEGYLSNRANAISDALALEAMGIIGSGFAALSSGTITEALRANLLYASTLGGMVIAHTGTTAVHSMGYSLTYFHNIDHGRANGLLLAEFLKLVEQVRPDRVAPIVMACGLGSVTELASVLDGLLGEKEPITPEEVIKFSGIAIKASNIANCVVIPTEADLQRIYRTSFGL
ncbi:MAG: iron-containing alcohol dehydrogenase [Oscillospiraceae bacterium]|nr:iron-containing alcohol dehydrogenase [Oscillospiraceae bacterium]